MELLYGTKKMLFIRADNVRLKMKLNAPDTLVVNWLKSDVSGRSAQI